ncbi:hypothetical protein [Leucobacter sp. L43]|uniref:hypothetical protein n=1 Tax=Leucobacter sp. L43 TaxID=2798040 RepID=UPI0019058907|nr:hypothetical protein [Leucobacter sp. L43]
MRIGMAATASGTTGILIDDRGKIHEERVEQRGAELSEMVSDILRRLKRRAASPGTNPIPQAITIDVSDALTPNRSASFIVVRIAPRPPVDAGHELSDSAENRYRTRIVHVSGGHTILGDELVPLDTAALIRIARSAGRAPNYVISGVGSLVNPSHEQTAGRILLEHSEPASIEFSHRFSSSAIAVRERTAVLNSALTPGAAALGTSLVLAVEAAAPLSRLYVTTNDGGSTTIAQLSEAPIHALHAGRSTELIGAAALCGIDDGALIVDDGTAPFFGEIIDGVPTVVPTHRASGPAVSTQAANVRGVTDIELHGGADRPLLVTHGAGGPSPLGLSAHSHADHSLRALGAACAPLSEWANRVVDVSNATEMEQALANARARVEARLVSLGAVPASIRIPESRVIATAYQHPRVVTVRVRGIAGESTGSILTGGAARAPR